MHLTSRVGAHHCPRAMTTLHPAFADAQWPRPADVAAAERERAAWVEAGAGIEDARKREIANWKNAAIALLAVPWWIANGLAFWPDIVIQIANWTYFNCQFTITYALLLFIYFRRNHAFYFIRNALLATSFSALIGYLMLPTAPPRMLGGLGFIVGWVGVFLHARSVPAAGQGS